MKFYIGQKVKFKKDASFHRFNDLPIFEKVRGTIGIVTKYTDGSDEDFFRPHCRYGDRLRLHTEVGKWWFYTDTLEEFCEDFLEPELFELS